MSVLEGIDYELKQTHGENYIQYLKKVYEEFKGYAIKLELMRKEREKENE